MGTSETSRCVKRSGRAFLIVATKLFLEKTYILDPYRTLSDVKRRPYLSKFPSHQ